MLKRRRIDTQPDIVEAHMRDERYVIVVGVTGRVLRGVVVGRLGKPV